MSYISVYLRKFRIFMNSGTKGLTRTFNYTREIPNLEDFSRPVKLLDITYPLWRIAAPSERVVLKKIWNERSFGKRFAEAGRSCL